MRFAQAIFWKPDGAQRFALGCVNTGLEKNPHCLRLAVLLLRIRVLLPLVLLLLPLVLLLPSLLPLLLLLLLSLLLQLLLPILLPLLLLLLMLLLLYLRRPSMHKISANGLSRHFCVQVGCR